MIRAPESLVQDSAAAFIHFSRSKKTPARLKAALKALVTLCASAELRLRTDPQRHLRHLGKVSNV